MVGRQWRRGPRVQTWLIAALVGWAASGYLIVREPRPLPQDIAHALDRLGAIAAHQHIVATVIDEPRLNRNLNSRFGVRVESVTLTNNDGEPVFQFSTQGRAYVTAPVLQTTGLHAGQSIQAEGRFYRPQPNLNPNGFDFQAYLKQRRAFTGFVADRIEFPISPHWGLWAIRQRILQAFVRSLGSPNGQVVSAMILGQRAVDVPYNILDLFAQVGLAHTIAASGFHVSLLLGAVLTLVRSRSPRLQLAVGSLTLVGYVALTGATPSVLRAALMGGAALFALTQRRKTKPLGVLLLAVTLLLLLDPNLLWHIGFQLSVMATLGLLISAPALMARLTWLPTTPATWVAVPLAATLWTLPLLLFHFNTVSIVSVALNVVATPLIMAISLGGMACGAIATLWPAAGSFIAMPLQYPVRLLLTLAHGAQQLPGSQLAIGQVALWQVIALYGLMLAAWQMTKVQQRWRWVAGSFVGLAFLPTGVGALSQTQITLLAAGGEPVWLLQNLGQTVLYNSGRDRTAFYTVQPFLKQAGINRLTAAIAPALPRDYPAGWQTLLQTTPVTTFYSAELPEALITQHPDLKIHPLNPGQSHSIGSLVVQSLGVNNPILRLQIRDTTWLILPKLDQPTQALLATGGLPSSHVLVWHGEELSEALIQAVAPKIALCYGQSLPESVERALQQQNVTVYWVERDGAVIWSPRRGFRPYLQDHQRSVLPFG